MRRQARYLVPSHKGNSYDQGGAFHQLSWLKVSKGEGIKGQLTGTNNSTKQEVLCFNFNEDALCPPAMTKEESDALSSSTASRRG